METEDYIISDEGMISFQLARQADVFSPDNAELIVEYSKDHGATYTAFGTISLNQLDVYTNGMTTVELAIPAAATSYTTRFRVRQNEINAENLDQFYLQAYSIMMNSNRYTQGLNANYEFNYSGAYIYMPNLNFLPITVPDGLFYPGTALNLEYEVTAGQLPTGTMLKAVITNPNPDLVLAEATPATSGTINTNVPSINGGSYSIQMQIETPYGTISSNSRSITVELVELEILSLTGNPARDVSGNPYFFLGDEIIVDYNIIGSAPLGVQLQIENINNEFVTIATDLLVSNQVTGIIPNDIQLAPNPQVRLALGDNVYNVNSTQQVYFTNGETVFPENENDSMIMSSTGKVDPALFGSWSNYATYGLSGERSIETKAFSFNTRGSIQFGIFVLDNYQGWETIVNKVSPISFQYSIDMGSSWVELGNIDPMSVTGSFNQFYPSYTLPSEALTTNTMFRVIQNEDNALGFGENVWTLYYLLVNNSQSTEIVSNVTSLNLQKASIALGTLDKSIYGPGEAITIPYNVVGNIGADVGFAVFAEEANTGDVSIVGTSDLTGLVQLATNLPVNLVETSNDGNSYELTVMPFQKSAGVTEPVLGYMEDFDDDEEDFIAIEGGEYQINNDRYYMYESGRRSVLSKALPQLSGDSVYFEAYTYLYENLFPSEGIVVEVTYDGGASYTVLDTVSTTGYHTVALATADMTDMTHLRWIQYVNFGQYQNQWRLQYMTYQSDESNIITSYLSLNTPPMIEIDYPNLPSQYTINGQQEVIYSGETFTLEYSVPEGISPLPATSEYIFYLGSGGNPVVDSDGNDIMLGSMTGTGSIDLPIPQSVFKNSYQILATVQIDDPDNVDPFVYYDMVSILGIDIYNPLLKTVAVTKEAFRGNDITVGMEFQTGTVNTADYYFHLSVNDDIIFTQQDAPTGNQFVQALPTDISTGNADVEILVTTEEVYSEGDVLTLDQYNDDEWIDQGNMYIYDYNYLRFDQTAAANRVISNSFDISNGGMVTFDFNYAISGNDWLESNQIVFEYSMDGGDTYTEIGVFPNDDYELGDGYMPQEFYFGKNLLNETTSFRFRRLNGNYGYAYVQNFVLTQWSNEAPIDVVADQISVLYQSVDLGSLPTSVCPGTTINLDYTINGVFGDKVSHQVQYNRNGSGYSNFPTPAVIGVTNGTGNFELKIPENFNGGDYKFRLYSTDATTDNTFNLTSLPTEDAMYLVPPIDFTGTTLSADQSLCEPGVVSYSLYNTQAYFEYQARNVATGALYGDPVTSETGGTQTLFTSSVDANIKLEIFVKAMSKDGLVTCTSGVLDDRISFTLVPQRTLFMYDNSSTLWTPADATYSICENNPQNLRLEAGYYDMNGNYVSSGITSLLWYRDDVANAVSSSSTLNTFNQSGDYFAEVLVGGCKYATNTVGITVLSVPDKPTVTATGDLTLCEGESASLSADMEYPYYQWFDDTYGLNLMSGSAQTIQVLQDGAYRLSVSDFPIDMGCMSPLSDPIVIDVIEDPNTYISRLSGGTIINDNNIVSCGDDVILRVSNEPVTYSWTLNGNAFSSTADDDRIRATATGFYGIQTVLAENGVTCVFDATDSIFVQISDEVEKPELTLTGDAIFCSGSGEAIINAPPGFAGYIWSDDDGLLTQVRIVEENTMSILETGQYFVSVVDEFGCESQASEEVNIQVVPLPGNDENVWTDENTLCGPGVADIYVNVPYYYGGNDRMIVYQLVNMQTGQDVGDPQTKLLAENENFVMLKTDTIYSETEYGIRVWDANVSNCEVQLERTVKFNVNLAEITVIGNQLFATPGASSYQWYRNGTPIVGSRGTATSLTIFDDAEYSVTLFFDYDCILTSETGSVKNLTGIDNRLSSDNVFVYPNPVKDQLIVDFANSYDGEITVEITNISGQIISTTIVEKHNQFMNMNIRTEELSEGIYFINFITNEQSLVKSIVKQ